MAARGLRLFAERHVFATYLMMVRPCPGPGAGVTKIKCSPHLNLDEVFASISCSQHPICRIPLVKPLQHFWCQHACLLEDLHELQFLPLFRGPGEMQRTPVSCRSVWLLQAWSNLCFAQRELQHHDYVLRSCQLLLGRFPARLEILLCSARALMLPNQPQITCPFPRDSSMTVLVMTKLQKAKRTWPHPCC